MKRRIPLILSLVLVLQTLASAATIYVDAEGGRGVLYTEIQDGIDAASSGDTVIVKPGTYSVPGSEGINFNGKAITLQSYDTNDPYYVANTIIDCGGSIDDPHRAFIFKNSEGSDTKVLGFTIINGFARGAKGNNGVMDPNPVVILGPYVAFDKPSAYGVTDPDASEWYWFRVASPGKDKEPDIDDTHILDHGNGGAILCVGASPTIQKCVIKNCNVVGPVGGNGADGLSGVWRVIVNDPNEIYVWEHGQWGGAGGWGIGNGYGGAICLRSGSNPLISDCTFENNRVRGGVGGAGGAGGNGAGDPPDYSDGEGSFGGDGGLGIGDGKGGAIYCHESNPTVVRCKFINNIATLGEGGAGGLKGEGEVLTAKLGKEWGPATDGADGGGYSHLGSGGVYDDTGESLILGGAVYYDTGSDPNFVDCEFIENKAYDSFWQDELGNPEPFYTFGGALYSYEENSNYLEDCKFTGNLGGAVLIDYESDLKAIDCTFVSNSKSLYGAVVVGQLSAPVYFSGCVFSNNSALLDGGAVECETVADFNDCSFTNNKAIGDGDNTGYGGAVDLYNSSGAAPAGVSTFTGCSFSGNEAVTGGVFSTEGFKANFVDCHFRDNKAENAGALDLVNGEFTITGGTIFGNEATDDYGGGISCLNSDLEIKNCSLEGNKASGLVGFGGAISFEGADNTHIVKNCLLIDNIATERGGALYNYLSSPEISNCTFSGNLVTGSGQGGAIYCRNNSDPNIIDSIFSNNNKIAIYEETSTSDAAISYSLFNNNSNGAFYDDGVLKSDSDLDSVNNNIDDDPLFESGLLGDYYLDQDMSAAIDSGSDTAVNIGLDDRTTDANNVIFDINKVDMGYHYINRDLVPLYFVDIGVSGGEGSITPASGNYPDGTVLELTATPEMGWYVESWSGTDDDSLTTNTNVVVVNSDKFVRVEFSQPRTLLVKVGGGTGYYADLKDAVDAANDRDTVIIYPGIYYPIKCEVNKAITIRSQNPEDPECVASTILDGLYGINPWTRTGFEFTYSAKGSPLLNGLTLQNFGGHGYDGQDGDTAGVTGEDGNFGYLQAGSAISIGENANPVIKNCMIKNNYIFAGDGGDGADADGDYNAGRGGWGGRAYGAGIYCGKNSRPTFINCRIIDNEARGGSGGNGGNQKNATHGHANYGGNWSTQSNYMYRNYDSFGPFPAPFLIGDVVDGDLWEYWGRYDVITEEPGYVYIGLLEGDYRWYSAYGGGVFCDEGSVVDFNNCKIIGNRTYGGMSGEGGTTSSGGKMEPLRAYELPSFGGGVYCAAGSEITFTDCTIEDNVASKPDPNGESEELYNFRLDPYIGHGGGVCAEDSAIVEFIRCTIDDNRADVGGGIHIGNTNTIIDRSEIISNRAFAGAGLYGNDGMVNITDSNVMSNVAGVPVPYEADDPDYDFDFNSINPNILYDPCLMEIMRSEGGGLHFWAVDVNVYNCQISNNQSETSAGGLYFGGEGTTSVENCLVLNNKAENDGGAISVSNFNNLTVSNCTILNNTVESDEPNYIKAGGALYCSDMVYVKIINSIIWDNFADIGPELAVNFGPATLDVSNCDVQGGEDEVYRESPEMLVWGPANIDQDPLFTAGPSGDYYLRQSTELVAVEDISPAVDAGSAPAEDLGFGGLTTSIDGSDDYGLVDLGYHYLSGGSLGIYELTLEVIGGHGTIAAGYNDIGNLKNGVYSYYVGTPVTVTATPDDGWRVSSWTNTSDNTSKENTNIVVMNADKHVTVSFEQPVILNVPGEYTSIQQALDVAEDGDVIVLGTGIYKTTYGFQLNGKDLEIRSSNPDDPCVVANTVIEQLAIEEEGGHRVAFELINVSSETVIDGLTIRGFRMYGLDGDVYGEAEGSGTSGRNGTHLYGSGIRLLGSSPIIKNCVIEDCIAQGGDGSAGTDGGDPNFGGGHGGWPGRAFGGGMACLYYDNRPSNPQVKNTIFRNCKAIGGNGGNGGNAATDSGAAGGKGGGWHYSENIYWPYGEYSDGTYDPYTRYTGLGGAVYVDMGCSPVFEGCEFTNNSTYGGFSGVTGTSDPSGLRSDPASPRRIDTFGGAVYCDSGSDVEFIDCEFNNNVANANLTEAILTEIEVTGDSVTPYTGLGGGVAYEDGAEVAFESCRFNGNKAQLGGGIFGKLSIANISKSDFRDNLAYHGAGVYCIESSMVMMDCNLIDNVADVFDSCDVNGNSVLGQGGGMHFVSSSAEIVDCNISGNRAKASGGGVYFSGDDYMWLENCLLTENTAGRDGGAISTNLYSKLDMWNCTVARNAVTGDGFGNSYGGGLYSSYYNNSRIYNSIFWGNYAQSGSQIAVGSGSEYEYMPSEVEIYYSNIQGGPAAVFTDTGCTVSWGSGNLYGTSLDNPRFVSSWDPNYPLGDYYLSQPVTGDPNQVLAGLSLCVDAGMPIDEPFAKYRYTTRTDGVVDTGRIDMGYHYPDVKYVPCKDCDINGDGIVQLEDYAIIASHWLDNGCSQGNQWCDGADLNYDTFVDMDDLLTFAECWLAEDTTAPEPNPAEWESVPQSLDGSLSIVMKAMQAEDNWTGKDVQYYFACTTGNGHDRDWDSRESYEDIGLVSGQVYGYQVVVRDTSAHNETAASAIGYAIPGEDMIPPVTDAGANDPYKAMWADGGEPNAAIATKPNAIIMTARTATDISGVEYFFDCIAGPGQDSEWQDSPTYEDTDLPADTLFTYCVRTRDKSSNQNLGHWSDEASARTPAIPIEVDTDPPVTDAGAADPIKAAFATGGYPNQLTVGSYVRHVMTAVVPSDASPPIQYRFICTSAGSFSSGWQTSETYSAIVGIPPTDESWRLWYVEVRDSAVVPNMGHPSDMYSPSGDHVPQ